MRYPIKKYAQALYEVSKGSSQAESEKIAKQFIALLTHYHDLSLLPKIIERYGRIRREVEKVAKVQVTTAKKLTGKTRDEIEKKFAGRIELEERVHPEVLGGIKLIINDEYLIDNTLQGRVERLYKALMAGAES